MRYTVAYMAERGITILVRFPAASSTPGCLYDSGASPDLPPVRSSRFDVFHAALGIEMIAAYSPEARERCKRMFCTHQDR